MLMNIQNNQDKHILYIDTCRLCYKRKPDVTLRVVLFPYDSLKAEIKSLDRVVKGLGVVPT